MDKWFETINARRALSDDAARELDNAGFTVVPGFQSQGELAQLITVYDRAMASADTADLRIGSKTNRINGLVNCGPAFDDLYLYPPLLEACCRTIRQPFRLSTMLARTLRPYTDADDLHQDFARDDAGWTMIGFIVMIDGFCAENGATQFVPGSHRQSSLTADYTEPVPTCRAGRLDHRLQWLRLAWAFGQFHRAAAPFDTGRLYPARRDIRDGSARQRECRDRGSHRSRRRNMCWRSDRTLKCVPRLRRK